MTIEELLGEPLELKSLTLQMVEEISMIEEGSSMWWVMHDRIEDILEVLNPKLTNDKMVLRKLLDICKDEFNGED